MIWRESNTWSDSAVSLLQLLSRPFYLAERTDEEEMTRLAAIQTTLCSYPALSLLWCNPGSAKLHGLGIWKRLRG